MKAVVKYETEDGKMFDSMEEAQAYENRLLNGKVYDVEFAISGTVLVDNIYAFSREETIKIAKERINCYDYDADWEVGEAIDVWP